MKTKMNVRIFVVILLCFIVLAACSSNNNNGANNNVNNNRGSSSNGSELQSEENETKAPVTIEFMGHGNPTERAIFEKLISLFEEQYDHVTVLYTSVPPGEYSQKLTTLVGSGSGPDVFYAGGSEFFRFAEAGILLNLEPYLAQTNIFDPNNVWPQALDRYRYDGTGVGQGDLYGLPKDVGPWSFVYNKDLFDAAGLDYPPTKAGEWDWNDMLEAAKTLTFDDQYGVGAYSVESAVWANGGNFIDYDTGTVMIDQPEFYEAMQFVADLTLVHGVSPSPEAEQAMNAYTRFISGKMGMFAMGPWDQPTFWDLPFNWDIAAWPASPNTGKTATWLGSMGFVVSENSNHPQEAFDLASFLSLDELGQREAYQLGQAVPNLISMAQGEFMDMEQSPESRQVFLDIINDYGRPDVPALSKNTEWIDTFWQEAGKVWNGDMSAKDFTAEVQPTLQRLYDDGNK